MKSLLKITKEKPHLIDDRHPPALETGPSKAELGIQKVPLNMPDRDFLSKQESLL